MSKIAGSTKVHHVWCVLKYTYGIVAIVAGLDKFFNILTAWPQFVNPFFLRFIPGGATLASVMMLMYLVGVIEITAGALVLSKYTRIGAYIVMAWLLFIAAQLLLGVGFYDVVVRDCVMAMGAYALARLSEVKAGK